MRLSGLFGVCVVIASHAPADAEPRRTLEPVTLRKKPGESAPAVAQLAANTPVTVLTLEGRWLRVRARGVEGYLARTTVSDPDAAAGGPAGRWSAPRRRGDDLVADMLLEVVAANAALRAEPRPDAAPVAAIARGALLVVLDAAGDPAWIRARDPAGHTGWIERQHVANGASSVAVTGAVTGVDLAGIAPPRRERDGAARGGLVVRAELGVGFRALGMDLTSNAEGGLTNYVLAADAVAATLDVDAAIRTAGRIVLAADARVSGSDSSPGISYAGPSAPAGKIGFRTLSGDAGIRIGVRAHRVFELAARAGGHYDTFLATEVENAGMLPRERLVGATLGARVDIAPERSRFAASTRFDALVVGWRAQTRGLEDGTASSAHALSGGITMRCAVVPHLAVFGGYDFSRASTVWSGASVREPGVTHTRRVDTAQLVQIGISAEL